MLRGLEARVERLAVPLRLADREAAESRDALRALGAVTEWVRKAALDAGIDPATIWALRLGEEAAAELAALGDAPVRRSPAVSRWRRSRAGVAIGLSMN